MGFCATRCHTRNELCAPTDNANAHRLSPLRWRRNKQNAGLALPLISYQVRESWGVKTKHMPKASQVRLDFKERVDSPRPTCVGRGMRWSGGPIPQCAPFDD